MQDASGISLAMNPSTSTSQNAPSANGSARPTGDQSLFELECINLLCRLENSLSLGTEHRKSGRTTEMLESAREILVTLVEFAEQQFDSKNAGVVQRQVLELYESIKHVETVLKQSSWRSVRALIGMKSSDDSEVKASIQQMASLLADVMLTALGMCAFQFRDSGTDVRQFAQGVQTLVEQLKRDW
jgi:hypothetical protein